MWFVVIKLLLSIYFNGIFYLVSCEPNICFKLFTTNLSKTKSGVKGVGLHEQAVGRFRCLRSTGRLNVCVFQCQENRGT